MNDLEKNMDAQVEETVEEMKLKIDEITAASSGVEDDEKARHRAAGPNGGYKRNEHHKT